VKKRNSTKFCETYFLPGLTGSVNRPLASSKIMVDEDFSLEASNIQRRVNPLSILGISSNTQENSEKVEPPEYPGH
jgi:hypothetical protein